MRELTPEECEFIAGGRLTANSSSFEDEVDEIVVVGSPPPYWPPPYWPPPYYPPPYYPPPYYPPPTGGGGGGSPPPPPPPPPPDDYPDCVQDSPEGVSPNAVLDAARQAAAAIAAGNDGSWEYGAIIYEMNGVVSYTTPVTQQDPGRVQFDTNAIPDGARVLGLVHNHPDQPGIQDGTPSEDDWTGGFDAMQSFNGTRGISVDANLLTFIYTDEDNKTRVYDKGDRNTNRESCAI